MKENITFINDMHHVKVNKMNIINWISIYIYKAGISTYVYVCVSVFEFDCSYELPRKLYWLELSYIRALMCSL